MATPAAIRSGRITSEFPFLVVAVDVVVAVVLLQVTVESDWQAALSIATNDDVPALDDKR